MPSGLLFRRNTNNTLIYTGTFKNGIMNYSLNDNKPVIHNDTLITWEPIYDLIPDLHWKLNDNILLTNKYYCDSGKYGTIMYSGHTSMNQPSTDAIIYKSLSFTNNEDYLYAYVPSAVTLNSFTFTCWLKTVDLQSDETIFCISRSDEKSIIQIKYNPYLYVTGTTSDATMVGINNFDFTSGWLFYAVCYDGNVDGLDLDGNTISGVVDFYVMFNSKGGYCSNGDQFFSLSKSQYNYKGNTTTCNDISLTTSNKILIGATGYTNIHQELSLIDQMEDVRFYYNRFLSAHEISSIYNEGVGTYQQTYKNYPTIKEPIHWYKLQEKNLNKNHQGLNMFSDSGLYARYLSGTTSNVGTSISTNNFPDHDDWTTCVSFHGNAGNTDFISDYDSNFLSGLAQYTLSFWLRYTLMESVDGDIAPIIQSFSNNSLNIYLNNNLGSIDFNGPFYGFADMDTDWHHFCFVKNKLTGLTYVDGILEDTIYSASVVSGSGVKIGGCDDSFRIHLFDIRVFNYPLVINEVEQLWNNNKAIMY